MKTSFRQLIAISIASLIQITPFCQQSLSIGDNVPMLQFTQVANYTTGQLSFSKLKGKLVILDFWGINCSPCIKAFPKLEALQKEYSDKLQIVLVSSASKTFIDSIELRRKATSKSFRLSNLPSVTSDSALGQLFPHRLIPHYVWINPEGRVIAITDGEEVTSDNINKMLNLKNYTMPLKIDRLERDFDKPLLPQIYDGKTVALRYYSSITNYVDGLAGGTDRYNVDSIDNTIRITRGNHTILDLFGNAISKGSAGSPYEDPNLDFGKRVILKVRDSNKYLFDSSLNNSYRTWKKNNSYCYELVLPLLNQEALFKRYLSDLCSFFEIDVTKELRPVRCISIEKIRDSSRIKYYPNAKAQTAYIDSLGVFHLKGLGRGLQVFRNKLSESNKDKPFLFVDETGITGKIDLEIHSELNDLIGVKRELNEKYGLDLVETEKQLEMIILAERILIKRMTN